MMPLFVEEEEEEECRWGGKWSTMMSESVGRNSKLEEVDGPSSVPNGSTALLNPMMTQIIGSFRHNFFLFIH